jgi:hypothetical protein
VSDRFDKCESHIERILCVDLERRFRADLEWDSQTPIVAMGHNFRADFFIESSSGKIVIKCDGREFHEWRDREDLTRDELMIEAVKAGEKAR